MALLDWNRSNCILTWLWAGVYHTVWVSLGCYNKYHRLGHLNSKHLFLTEAGKSKIKVPADSV